ncbi:MAG: PQQ-dependent sugar dehydrogenase [Patescibacteria group bacterium]
MKKILFGIIALALLGAIAWAGFFYYKNLRGSGPAFGEAPYDITERIPGAAPETASDAKEMPPLPPTDVPLRLPDGFEIGIFAKNLPNSRVMAFDVLGNMYVSQTRENKVAELIVKDGRVTSNNTLFGEMQKPHGLAFDPKDPNILYIAEEGKISRVQVVGEGKIEKFLEKIVDLPLGEGHRNHFTRTIAFGPDGRLYVAIGSSCNVCRENDERRAAIYSMNPDGGDFKLFAKGLRNTVFFDWHPKTNKLWGADMGRDELGDDLPPDEINIIEEGKNYGWPICYGKNIHDTAFDKNTYIRNPCMEPFETPSHIDLPAHSAPLGIAFIPEDSGWPKDYVGDLLVAYHGSWNRTVPTGYSIVRLELDDDGNFIGTKDFATGWLTNEGAAGRPVGLTFHDGALYVSDDKAGVIYRVRYGGTQAQEEKTSFTPVPNVEEHADTIRVTNLKPDDRVSDTLMVEGEARRWWFSGDGLFTIRLVDSNGTLIGQYDAKALADVKKKNDAMVPFRSSLVFEYPKSDTGFLIFERWGWEKIVGGWKNMMVFPVRFRE